jgi:hypothetical protein
MLWQASILCLREESGAAFFEEMPLAEIPHTA